MKKIVQFMLVLAFPFFYSISEALAQWRGYGQGMGGARDDGVGIWHGVVWNDHHGDLLDCRHRGNHFPDQVALCFYRGQGSWNYLGRFSIGDLEEKICPRRYR
jgi:hypothetical protein